MSKVFDISLDLTLTNYKSREFTCHNISNIKSMIEQNNYQKVESQIEHLALTDLESSAITILKYVISNQ
jgi:hypothetical protein